MPDVIVVGSGTAGCFTSYLLAKNGLDVALLDKSSGLKERIVCTGVISKEAYQKFSLPPESVLRDIDSFKIFAPSGECFHYKHFAPFACVINREFLHKWFFKKSLDEGVKFLPDCQVHDFEHGSDEIKVFFKSESNFHNISGKVLVLATGTDLALLEKAGLEGPPAFLQGIQIEAEMDGLDEIEVYLGREIAPKSFAWCVPLDHKKAKIGLSTEKNSAEYLDNLLQNSLLKERVKKPYTEAGFRFIPLGMSAKSFGKRVLAVGDAAGQVKTTTGGGVYYGLICSELASETILEAFSSKDFSNKMLKQYEKKWQKVLQPEIQNGLFMRKLYALFDDYKINLAINLANNDGVRPLIINRAKFDWQKDFLLSLLKRPVIQKLFL